MIEKFTHTSDKPYSRHRYKIVTKEGKHVITDSWEQAQEMWWNKLLGSLSHIEVLDIEEKKGFGK